MTLVDTNVWIDHLRSPGGLPELAELLRNGAVLTHPFVLGELVLGSLGPGRLAILQALALIPGVGTAAETDVIRLVENCGLHGSGIGWVDAHLLAAARLAGVRLWTRDRKLHAAAVALSLA